MKLNSRIYVAGHTGLVGQAVVKELRRLGFHNLVLKPKKDLDLTQQHSVHNFFSTESIEFVFLAAARVGGIYANSKSPADFLADNLNINTNVIQAAAKNNVRKLLFLGSGCMYPRETPEPIKESQLLGGKPEPTNEAYALAKISGLKLCESYRKQHGKNFICAIPTNLYGPGDNFHPTDSHVVPSLIRKIHIATQQETQEVKLWGTGSPRRDLLYVDDLARALVLLMQKYNATEPINIGSGTDYSIRHIAKLISHCLRYSGSLKFDDQFPDGAPSRRLDITKISKLGWSPEMDLRDGVALTYEWALRNGKLDMKKDPLFNHRLSPESGELRSFGN